jgi:hypothetical protein
MFGVPSCDELLKISCLKFKLHDKLLIGVQGHVGLRGPGLVAFHVSNCSNIVLFSCKVQNVTFKSLNLSIPPTG